MSVYDNLQMPNIGQNFVNAFEAGAKRRNDYETQNALSKYATNPSDPQAMGKLAEHNPELAIKLRQHDQEMALKGLDQYKDQIQIGAALAQANPPTDQASWDRLKAEAQRYHIDVSHLPQAWDAQAQQYVQGIIAADKHLNPQHDTTPSAVREYEYYQNLPPEQRPGFDRFRQSIRPQIFGSAESGYNVFDPNAQPPTAQNMPHVTTPQEAMALPPGSQFMLPDGRIGTVPGGAGGNTSGNFPDSAGGWKY